MGLEKRNKGVRYVSIVGGEFRENLKEATPTSITRVNKNGKTVIEEPYPSLSGYLADIEVTDHKDYGKQWKITISDDGDLFVFNTSYAGNIAKSFLKMLPNFDLSNPIKLLPSMKKDDNGKDKTSLFIYQNGGLVPYAHTKANPNGMPDRVLLKVQGADVWDYTAQIEFFQNIVENTIKPTLKGEVFKNTKESEDDEDVVVDTEAGDEDAPF